MITLAIDLSEENLLKTHNKTYFTTPGIWFHDLYGKPMWIPERHDNIRWIPKQNTNTCNTPTNS